MSESPRRVKRSPRALVGWITALGIVFLVAIDVFPSQISSILNLDPEVTRHFEFVLLTFVVLIVINLVFHFSSIQSEEAIESISQTAERLERHLIPSAARIEAISAGEFYRRLQLAIEGATHRVNLCLLAPVSPENARSDAKRRLYLTLPDQWKSHPKVRYRLLLGSHPSLDRWATSLATAAASNQNVSIRRLPDAVAASATQIQLIDQRVAYLDHLSAKPPGALRDLELVGADTVALLGERYDLLWSLAKESEIGEGARA